jgi:oxygen-dependent protoporphyrinogen oxidase
LTKPTRKSKIDCGTCSKLRFAGKIDPALYWAERDPRGDMQRVVIVGGGISGLALAYRLQQEAPAVAITVLEKEKRFGGTLGTERRDGFTIEIGANGFLDNKPFTLALCHDLGLDEQLTPASESSGRNRFVVLDGKLRALPSGPLSFLRANVLSWAGKISAAAEVLRPRGREDRDESIDAFFRRRFGSEAAARLADPFVTGIYAGDPALLSLRACFPRLAELEREYGSLLWGLIRSARRRQQEGGKPSGRPGRLWSFRGGLGVLIERLCEQMKVPPLASVNVRRISRQGLEGASTAHWLVEADGCDRWQADAVVLTCPAYQQAEILADLDSFLAEQIAVIPYNRVVVVVLGYRREDVAASVDGFGFLVPQRTGRGLLGVQWCSSIFPERSPPGTVLLRAMCGGWSRAEMADWDDARLLRAVDAELRHFMGIRGNPLFHRVVRWHKAIPQYTLGHLERVAQIEQRAASYPGLFLTGNAYRGVALNDCVERGGLVARQVAQFLAIPAKK